MNYKVIGVGRQGVKTTNLDEHIIDAVGLACWAAYTAYGDKFKPEPATKSYQVALPKFVKSKFRERRERDFFRSVTGGLFDRGTAKGFVRGQIGDGPIVRSKI